MNAPRKYHYHIDWYLVVKTCDVILFFNNLTSCFIKPALLGPMMDAAHVSSDDALEAPLAMYEKGTGT